MGNLEENKSKSQEITDELFKKSKELREKHKKSHEIFENLKERTEKFLATEMEHNKKINDATN